MFCASAVVVTVVVQQYVHGILFVHKNSNFLNKCTMCLLDIMFDYIAAIHEQTAQQT